MSSRQLMALLVSALLVAACQSVSAEPVPARLAELNEDALNRLQQSVGEAVGRASAELNLSGIESSGTFAILPARPGPYEMNSPALPAPARLILKDGACYVELEDGARTVPVPGLDCEAINASAGLRLD